MTGEASDQLITIQARKDAGRVEASAVSLRRMEGDERSQTTGPRRRNKLEFDRRKDPL